jgi:nucleoside-diphosphate-sugar epimerase
MNLPIDAARRSAVDSAKVVVEFARACPRLQKAELVSTVGVGGRMPLVPEEWLTQARAFHNTYEQAKAEAEDFLREQIEKGALPATIHRPSMVVGDSRTGKIIHYQIFYHLCEFLSGRQTRGLLPELTGTRLDTIPVDVVARALQWSSTRSETVGRVLHLCSGPTKSIEIKALSGAVREVFEAKGRRVPPLRWAPLWFFRAALPVLRVHSDPRHRKALANLSLFLDYARDRQRFACGRTTASLAQASIAVPAPAEYLGKVVAAYLESRTR